MPRLEFGWTCALLSPVRGVCVRWCNVVPFHAAGQGISREDSAAQLGAERLQAAFRPRRNSQPSRADGVAPWIGPTSPLFLYLDCPGQEGESIGWAREVHLAGGD